MRQLGGANHSEVRVRNVGSGASPFGGHSTLAGGQPADREIQEAVIGVCLRAQVQLTTPCRVHSDDLFACPRRPSAGDDMGRKWIDHAVDLHDAEIDGQTHLGRGSLSNDPANRLEQIAARQPDGTDRGWRRE